MNKKHIFAITLILFVFAIPVLAQGLEINYPTLGKITSPTNLAEYVRYLFVLSLIAAGIAAFWGVTYGGFKYMTSGDSPEKLGDAKSRITSGLLGLTILLSSYLILTTINPQLVSLNLPGLSTPVPFDEDLNIPPGQKEPSFQFQEIPVGTLINAESANGYFYSDYQGVLHKERLKRIKIISAITEQASEKLKDLVLELRTSLDQCQCQNCKKGTPTIAPCGPGPSECVDTCNKPCEAPDPYTDSCPNRDEIKIKQKKITRFSATFAAFMLENEKVENYIVSSEQVITDLNQLFPAGREIRNLINRMVKVENEQGEYKENMDSLWKELKKLERAEAEITNCSPQATSYDNFANLKEFDLNIEKIKKIDEFKDILPGEDTSTFYCEK